jgi:signal transduction histidine kinase
MEQEGTHRAVAVRRWGFAGTMVLAFAAWVLSVAQVQHARQDVTVLARTADRSTFLVGEVGRQISRLRAATLERLVLRNRDVAAGDEDLRAVAVALDRALGELEPLLQPEEQRRWNHFVPLLARFRHHVDGVLAAARRGELTRARSVLVDEVNPLAVQLQARLDELTWLNEEQSAEMLAAADGTLARVVVIESVLGAGLLLGLAVIWWTVLGTLARQRRSLEEYVARVESSNRDLDAFAGRIAHDLRNALGPVTFGAAALRQVASRPETIARIAGQLERTVQRTGNLIEGLLAFSRAGRAARQAPPAPIAPTVESVLEELAPLAARVDATLDVHLCDVAVACPPGLLHLVAANLIGNGLKFLEGRPLRRLTVTARPVDGGWCELVVGDTGPGIPRESLPRIFEPFYRVPGTTVEGTGIGLATVRRIVSAHEGTIAVESELGSGAVFRVRLLLSGAGRPATADTAARAGA